MAAEREALSQELARFALDGPTIAVEGQRDHRVLRCATTYNRAAGPGRVERRLYRQRPGSDHAVCPLELRDGIIEGYWTPLAAKQATWVVAHLTPKEGEELFALRGNMAPSKSTPDRWPQQLSAPWESQRRRFEAPWRQQADIPRQALSMAVSLDGVMAPRKDGQRHTTRAQAVAAGQAPRGPAGYQEVGCATGSYADPAGHRLGTRRMARMPEANNRTLNRQLTAEVREALGKRPDVRVVKRADGTPDTWSYLGATLPGGAEVLDFYHAVAHLGAALGAAYGAGTAKDQERLAPLSQVLREEVQRVDKSIEALGRVWPPLPPSAGHAAPLDAALSVARSYRM